jgi:hypothetical protein
MPELYLTQSLYDLYALNRATLSKSDTQIGIISWSILLNAVLFWVILVNVVAFPPPYYNRI